MLLVDWSSDCHKNISSSCNKVSDCSGIQWTTLFFKIWLKYHKMQINNLLRSLQCMQIFNPLGYFIYESFFFLYHTKQPQHQCCHAVLSFSMVSLCHRLLNCLVGGQRLNPDWTNTRGLKITVEIVLSLLWHLQIVRHSGLFG